MMTTPATVTQNAQMTRMICLTPEISRKRTMPQNVAMIAGPEVMMGNDIDILRASLAMNQATSATAQSSPAQNPGRIMRGYTTGLFLAQALYTIISSVDVTRMPVKCENT